MTEPAAIGSAAARGPADGMAELDALAPLPWLPASAPGGIRAALDGRLARETWKHSPLGKMLQALLEAPVALELPLQSAQEGVLATPFSSLDAPPALAFDMQRYPLAGVVLALSRDGWLIDVRQSPARPLALAPIPGIQAPLLIRVRPGCRVEVEEGPGQGGVQAQLRFLRVERGATVHWSRAELDENAEQWSLLHARLDAGAGLQLHQHALGASFRRLDSHLALEGRGASCECIGAGVADQRRHLDQQHVAEHIGPEARSRAKLHNLAADQGRCSFNGRIHIHPRAAGADADLSNRNLVLGTQAEINTKPELEIYNDDVRCAHGATVGRLQEDALFYLRSRGLGEAAAHRLLGAGFLAECIGGPFAAQVSECFLGRLARAAASTPAAARDAPR